MKAGCKQVKALFESSPAIKQRETKRRGKLNSLRKDVADGAGGHSLPRWRAPPPTPGSRALSDFLPGRTHRHTSQHLPLSHVSLHVSTCLPLFWKQHPTNAGLREVSRRLDERSLDTTMSNTGLYVGKLQDLLAVQWLRLHTSHAGVTGSIPGWGARSHMLHGRPKKF